MGITYHEASGCFKLDAGSTSYVIGIMGKEQYATLLYYGPYVPDGDLRELYLYPSPQPSRCYSYGKADQTQGIRS